MDLTAEEQYLLELINRARLDPAAEASRYGLSLNAGLTSGTIDTSSKQPLAPNAILHLAAETHSNWMLANDVFSHTGEGGSRPGDRMVDAGYVFTGDWSWRENLAWTGTTGALNMQTAIDTHHEGLYRSSGHRVNTFADNIREVGIAQVQGQFTQDGTTFNTSMLSLNFAKSGAEVFLTGVAYTDADGDAFYDIGEGSAGISFEVLGNVGATASAGGYAVALTPDEFASVVVRSIDGPLAVLELDLSGQNAKLDYFTQPNGSAILHVSTDMILVSGVPDALLIGTDNLTLDGNADANRLFGNSGRNILDGHGGDDALFGGAGVDSLFGGAGDDFLDGGTGRDQSWDRAQSAATEQADLLIGGAGNDVLVGRDGFDTLDGGSGNDTLTGGGGRDTFVFNGGRDDVLDFDPFVDRVEIDASALGLDPMTTDLAQIATSNDGNTTLVFNDQDQLTFFGVGELALLVDEIQFV